MSGKPEDIKEFMQKFKKKYNITELGRMKKHLGMWYEWKKDEKGEPYVKVTMDEMLEEIIEKFEKVIGKEVKIQNTPGYPGKFLTKITIIQTHSPLLLLSPQGRNEVLISDSPPIKWNLHIYKIQNTKP